MTSQFSAADIQLTLHRYPEEQESNLQAWDAADEHLLKQLAEEEAPQSVLIINDSFGACCAPFAKVTQMQRFTGARMPALPTLALDRILRKTISALPTFTG